MTNLKHRRFALIASPLAAALITLVPLAAQAQRKSPLEDAPAIRKRVELRETRFEIGPGFSSTLNQDFYHTFLIGLRAGFHLNDWLSIAGFASFAVANSDTGFHDRLVETLPTGMGSVPREPTQTQAVGSMQKIKSLLGAQLEFVPFTGKYSMFGKIFAHYDFYLFGGGGFMDVEPTDPSVCGAANTMSDCGQTGFKPGGQGGVGLHTYFNNWLALNIELRDFVARLNPSGRDVNGDGVADGKDVSWTNTYMVTANVMFFLPTLAAISQ
jgi:outer membrane beta-barrel protein